MRLRSFRLWDRSEMHRLPLIFFLCFLCPSTGFPQVVESAGSADPDWHSALVLHFDFELESDSPADLPNYLARVTLAIESGWLASTGADLVVVGPIIPRAADIIGGASDPLIETTTSTDTTSSVSTGGGRRSSGSREESGILLELWDETREWQALLAVARDAGVQLAPVVRFTGAAASADAVYAVMQWGHAQGFGGLFIDSATGSEDVTASLQDALALDPFADDDLWIGLLLGTRSPEPGALDAIDVLIKPWSMDSSGDWASFVRTYEAWASQIASSPIPLVGALPASVSRSFEDPYLLLLPGSLWISTSPPESDARPLWVRTAGFRQRHPAVSIGDHEELPNATYSFSRTLSQRGTRDAVIVALGASGRTTLNVSRVFSDNALLRDAVTGSTAFVSFGMATFDADAGGILLIEEAY